MDKYDRKICEILQHDGRASSAEIAKQIGVSVSTANERVRKLVASGSVRGFRAIIDPDAARASFCCHVFIDMAYDGEDDAIKALCARPEVMELHHISGAHSYLAKVRVADADAMQEFLQQVVKPMKAIERTETLFSLYVAKESTEVLIQPNG